MRENLFTLKEIEAKLQMSKSVVEKLVTNKKIEHYKINGRVRVSESHFNDFLERSRVSVQTQMAQN